MKITLNPKLIAWAIVLIPMLYCIGVSNWEWYTSGDFNACKTGVCLIGSFATVLLFVFATFIGVVWLFAAMNGEFEATTIELGKKGKTEKDSLLLQELGKAEIQKDKKKADKVFKELKDRGHFN